MITAHGTKNGEEIHVIGLTQRELDHLQDIENPNSFVQVVDDIFNIAIFYAETEYLLQEKLLNLGVIKSDDPNL